MKFAFELCQRVTVPNTNGAVQGMVIAALARVGMENVYDVRALSDDGYIGEVEYSEPSLITAQKMAPVIISGTGGGAGGYSAKSSRK